VRIIEGLADDWRRVDERIERLDPLALLCYRTRPKTLVTCGCRTQ
jgi:hypothetical protein